MDRSFLTNESIIQASRDFVCIRVATYESESEAEFMKSLYTRNGTVENTTFCLLAPDGKTKLARASRGPHGSPNAMAREMARLVDKYKAKGAPSVVPSMQTVELALNVAACDNLPLVIVSGTTAEKLKQIENKMLPAVWSKKVAGKFVYGSTNDKDDLKLFSGKKYESGIMVIQPGKFGLSGRVLDRMSPETSAKEIETRMLAVAKNFSRKKTSHNAHVNAGIALGIEWKTKLPETDAQSVRAKERARGR